VAKYPIPWGEGIASENFGSKVLYNSIVLNAKILHRNDVMFLERCALSCRHCAAFFSIE